MPDRVNDTAAAYCRIWAERGVRAWEEEWWLLARDIGDRIGRLINAAPDTVTMQPNVTSAQAVILSCFDFTPPRDKVVMVDMEFPSMLYLYRRWLEGRGRVEVVTSDDGITVPLDKLLSAIDETTLLVPVSHVFFRSATILDAKAVIERAHEVGAMVVLDIFQSIGTVPVDVAALETDFAVGGCLKWLCGGPGACFMYVRPDLNRQLQPRLTGWLAHENPFAFERETLRFTTGAYRFLNGTPVIPAYYTCQPGLEIISEIGVPAIRERSVTMTSYLIAEAQKRGWSVFTPTDPAQRGGTVSLQLPEAATVCERLLAQDFLVDYRPEAGVRVSPHFYNTDNELSDLIAAIDDILADMN
ncbi:MAG: aminotransferase class V-fold PLP-dependent enzyme [Candidatus Zixiibacteriota bacterium]|nr:MAG: aminotransferase class V-fold PLP-dependent enzyme [candidate division Zixibacteria bacterium]